MKEEEASLMIIRHAIEKLEVDKKQQVMACVREIRAGVRRGKCLTGADADCR
ncbi:hypothetical protein [Candidatus Pantoea persica]|uniref:hypothetical protein n=1 Tax=Candidatus Pantoea persica TaxID=2518128 RepID=UPI00215D6AFD|nr:hypothetical protein [Candidatus Pantoea persica]